MAPSPSLDGATGWVNSEPRDLAELRGRVVLVHGAFASPAGWDGVAAALQKDGYQTATPALGLVSVSDDVAIVRSTLDSIPGDKILVGHSYGGFVITNAASGRSDVRGLVYTAAYVPDSGETITSLSVGYTSGAFLAHLVFAPAFPLFIVAPQFFPFGGPRVRGARFQIEGRPEGEFRADEIGRAHV